MRIENGFLSLLDALSTPINVNSVGGFPARFIRSACRILDFEQKRKFLIMSKVRTVRKDRIINNTNKFEQLSFNQAMLFALGNLLFFFALKRIDFYLIPEMVAERLPVTTNSS